MSSRPSGAYRTQREVATAGESRCGAYGLAHVYARFCVPPHGMRALAWWHGRETAIRCFPPGSGVPFLHRSGTLLAKSNREQVSRHRLPRRACSDASNGTVPADPRLWEGASCGAERQSVRSRQHQELGRRPTPTCRSGQGGALQGGCGRAGNEAEQATKRRTRGRSDAA